MLLILWLRWRWLWKWRRAWSFDFMSFRCRMVWSYSISGFNFERELHTVVDSEYQFTSPANSVLMFFCFSRRLPVFCLCFLFDVLHCAEAEMVPHGDLICTCWWCRMLSTFVHTCWWFTGLASRNINSRFLMFGYWVFELHIHFGYKPLPTQMLHYSVFNKLGYTSQSGLYFHKEWLKT